MKISIVLIALAGTLGMSGCVGVPPAYRAALQETRNSVELIQADYTQYVVNDPELSETDQNARLRHLDLTLRLIDSTLEDRP